MDILAMVGPALVGIGELWPILIVVLLLFGANQLPKLARSMGSSVNEFKKGMADGQSSDQPAENGSKEK
jgi:sec-independent protein translocase protein TatA